VAGSACQQETSYTNEITENGEMKMAMMIDTLHRVFTLQTKHSTYQMKADELGVLLHTYYGEKTDHSDKGLLCYRSDRGFSGNPFELGTSDRTYSLDSLPQEYSGFGTGDYRITALRVRNQDGSQAVDLRYTGHRVEKGKYGIPGLPAVYAEETEAETLVLCLRDACSGLEVELYYGILEELDTITRAVKITNRGNKAVFLEKAASMNLDWEYGDFQWISFYGRHSMEMHVQKTDVHHGIQSVGSVRGISSHQYNPLLLLCERGANETMGSCYGFSFVYSGEFLMELEKDQLDRTRLLCGIHPDNFSWTLEEGETLWLPEVIMTYSDRGLGKLSGNFHRVIREHICRGKWRDKRRPILINNWEATYFDFTGERLITIAREAKKLGIELFVMDDGWFGKRQDDNSGLGDWVPNEQKLDCTLQELAGRIVAEGMEFGIWLEPESISVDSDLYRSHPEWAVEIPGRRPCLSRNQLVLDFSRRDVQAYIIETITELLQGIPVTYVKWDFNRAICDKFSGLLDSGRQGEFSHRYVLGLYSVLETLIENFPEILFEGCCGGGGRFDAGILYYMPQIWCSDTTDAIERLGIQYGASFGYPVSAMGSHVSTVPNHQTGRITPLSTRGCVAMAGTFGYELDIEQMTPEEKEEVRKQIAIFQTYAPLIQKGVYYRLSSPLEGTCTVWEIADPDGREALVSAVYHHAEANPVPVRARVQGLRDELYYRLRLHEDFAEKYPERTLPYGFGPDETISGAALRQYGFVVPDAADGFQAWQISVEVCGEG
jgi:alpha-galactosidase